MGSTTIANTLFKLPELKYDFDALEPHIDRETMEVHYTGHHQGYVNKFNKAIEGQPIEVAKIEDIFAHASNYSPAVRNNGGGHYNHSFFWNILSPDGGGSPTGDLASKIKESFGGSFESFKERFAEVATSRFGSGWAWLVLQGDELSIGSTPNQDNPLMDISEFKGIPILGLDVWEHAYYLKYRNKRAEYIDAFWNIVNWEEVEKNYNNALSL